MYYYIDDINNTQTDGIDNSRQKSVMDVEYVEEGDITTRQLELLDVRDVKSVNDTNENEDNLTHSFSSHCKFSSDIINSPENNSSEQSYNNLNEESYLSEAIFHYKNESFCCDLIKDFSVLIFQISLPFFKEKHLSIFSKSTTKNLSLNIFTWELKGAELFFDQIKFPLLRLIE